VQVGILLTIVHHTRRVDYWEGCEQDFLSFLIIVGCWGRKFVGTDAENALERKPLLTLNFLLKSLGLPEHQGLSKNWVSGIPKSQGLSFYPLTGHFMGGIPHIPTYSHIFPHQSQPPVARLWCSLFVWQRDSELPGLGPEKTRDRRNRDRIGTCVALAGSDWLPPPCRIQEEAWTSLAESFESLRSLAKWDWYSNQTQFNHQSRLLHYYNIYIYRYIDIYHIYQQYINI